MEKFSKGETAVIKSDHKVDGAHIDPDTSITISIYDPQNGAEVTDGTMVSSGETGKHYYNYATEDSNIIGVYRAIVTTIHSERTTMEKTEFEVVNYA